MILAKDSILNHVGLYDYANEEIVEEKTHNDDYYHCDYCNDWIIASDRLGVRSDWVDRIPQHPCPSLCSLHSYKGQHALEHIVVVEIRSDPFTSII